MTKRELIKKLEDLDILSECIAHGLIGANVRSYIKWYDRYQELLRLGSKKMDAYATIAEENGVCEGSVRHKIREMN